MLKAVVISQLAYHDVGEAVSWLGSVFGFKERLRIGKHRAQLTIPGGGAIVVIHELPEHPIPTEGYGCHRLLVRVADVNSHHLRAARHGAKIRSAPKDYPSKDYPY